MPSHWFLLILSLFSMLPMLAIARRQGALSH